MVEMWRLRTNKNQAVLFGTLSRVLGLCCPDPLGSAFPMRNSLLTETFFALSAVPLVGTWRSAPQIRGEESVNLHRSQNANGLELPLSANILPLPPFCITRPFFRDN